MVPSPRVARDRIGPFSPSPWRRERRTAAYSPSHDRLGRPHDRLGRRRLFYGDGMITPAISVLSAVEGLEVAAPLLKSYVIPITVLVLIGLFVVQSRGSERIGAYFGPIMAVWFAVLADAGLIQVVRDPGMLAALNPMHALRFLAGHGRIGYLALGSVFLALTGAEALYADIGHFGRGPIRLDWFVLVLPALVLNYFGQGALVLAHPEAADSPFFKLFPDWGLWPIVLLATAATVIASQAVISGAFSLSQQACSWASCRVWTFAKPPRRRSGRSMSRRSIGCPWCAARVGALVRVVRQPGRRLWDRGPRDDGHHNEPVGGRSPPPVALEPAGDGDRIGFFLVVDVAFFAANAVKIPQGGWFPLLIGAAVFTLMSTWRRGRQIILERTSEDNPPLQQFIAQIDPTQLPRVKGTAVYPAARRETAPYSLLDNLRHARFCTSALCS